jgi:hypothetical protein
MLFLFRPHQSTLLHWLYLQAYGALLVVTYASQLFIAPVQDTSRARSDEGYAVAVAVLAMLINAAFVVFALARMLLALEWKQWLHTALSFIRGIGKRVFGWLSVRAEQE